MFKRNSILVLTVFLSACSINQHIDSVSNPLPGNRVCIIENSETRAGFLNTYHNALRERGYNVEVLPPYTAEHDCEVTSTYVGKWKWDLALYLAYAEIKVLQNDQLIGKALYDSTSGGANMSKFIDAENKITEMTDRLYPLVK